MTERRKSYQRGTVVRIKRKNRPDIWVLRYYEYDLFGHATQRALTFATIEECPTKADAERRADAERIRLTDQVKCVYFRNLVDVYKTDGMPPRDSTQPSYRSNLKRLENKWGDTRLDWMCAHTVAIEDWFKTLETLPGKGKGKPRPLRMKTRTNIRALLHRLFDRAMAWGYIKMDRNPIDFVEIRRSDLMCMGIVPPPARKRRVLPLAKYERLIHLPQLPPHVRLICQLLMMTGLRISEVLGLRWENVDIENLVIYVRKSSVGKHVGPAKTEESEAEVYIDAALGALLQEWQQSEVSINGWVFGNIQTGRPFHRDSLLEDHLAPVRGIIEFEDLGWHTFRHTYRALLREYETPLEVQRYLLRHASITTTLNYGKFGPESETALRAANSKIVAVLPKVVGGMTLLPSEMSARERRRIMRGLA